MTEWDIFMRNGFENVPKGHVVDVYSTDNQTDMVVSRCVPDGVRLQGGKRPGPCAASSRLTEHQTPLNKTEEFPGTLLLFG